MRAMLFELIPDQSVILKEQLALIQYAAEHWSDGRFCDVFCDGK